jgi:hypothetical protein
MGGTTENGFYDSYKKKGFARLELHDKREFSIPLRYLWDEVRKSEEQSSLFAA